MLAAGYKPGFQTRKINHSSASTLLERLRRNLNAMLRTGRTLPSGKLVLHWTSKGAIVRCEATASEISRTLRPLILKAWQGPFVNSGGAAPPPPLALRSLATLKATPGLCPRSPGCARAIPSLLRDHRSGCGTVVPHVVGRTQTRT